MRVVAAFSMFALVAVLAGCDRPQAPTRGQSQQSAFRRADRGEALLKAAATQLSDLPSDIDTDLRAPEVVLDSSQSGDEKGEDVLAVCTVNPNVPEGTINYITVPARNGRFRNLGVKSGDILKYYVLEDETVDEESRRSGFTRLVAMELTIAQVLDDNTLLIEGGLNQEVPIPARIEIWRYVDDRQKEINRQLHLYGERRLPPLGWEPSPDSNVLTQLIVWLNQWLRQSDPKSDWRVDPLLKSLPAELLADKLLKEHISEAALAAPDFKPHEGRLLQEAAWHRDISRWARGDSFSNVERAASLFDWTIRNVQLVDDSDARAHRPWQILLYGRGTAEQRAWVFALLCRQLGLDVVVLALQPPQSQGAAPAATVETKFWLTAFLDDDQLYLFDTRLGLAIPGPDGEGVATLKQVQEDDSLLRRLDLPEAAYPVTSEAAKRVAAYIVADPFDLTRRARHVEEKLTGDDRLALTVAPSAVAGKLTKFQVADVRLWRLPFETLRDQLALGKSERWEEVFAFEPFAIRPVLWKARMRHFQGRRHVADEGSSANADEMLDDHGEAAGLYTAVRLSEREIERAKSTDQKRVEIATKLAATYWLGVMSFDEGKYDVAAHWLSRPEIRAEDSPLAAGADYNLARTLEAQGKFEEAAAVLDQDRSPQQHGNKLRAQRLRSRPNESSEQSAIQVGVADRPT
jgi:hypothetical protein